MMVSAVAFRSETADADVPEDAPGDVTGPDFRWFWGAHTVSTFGDQVSMVAMPLAVYARTGSALAVGIAAAMEGITALVFALAAGVLADRLDHRRLIVPPHVARFVLLGRAPLILLTRSS